MAASKLASVVIVVAVVAVGACRKHDAHADGTGSTGGPAPSGTTPAGTATQRPVEISPHGTKPAGSGTTTIHYDPDGKHPVEVEGAPPLLGDPKLCRMVKPCCRALERVRSEGGLMCGMVVAQGGDCGKALATMRKWSHEAGVSLPHACMAPSRPR